MFLVAWYFECLIQCFSVAFDVLIKISESYRPQIPLETNPRGHRIHTTTCQNKFQTHLIKEYNGE